MNARWMVLGWGLGCCLAGCDETAAKAADVGADTGAPDAAADGEVEDPYPLDDQLRFNHVQARGTHNSYHVAPARALVADHAYTHLPLGAQLEVQGVRQFELDVHYRPGEGFHVLHLPLIDPETTCERFVDCLGEVKTWSDAHRDHLPIVIWVEPKDEADGPASGFVPIDGHYRELEEEILAVFPQERIIRPDDVRGVHATLPEAIAADGWPTLREARGRVAFALLDSTEHRDGFLDGDPTLAGRVMFVDADTAADPFAAMFKVDNAEADGELVRALVSGGFMVTSNADSAGGSDEDNTRKRDATLAAGSHYLSSDVPAPLEGRDYWLEIPDGAPARCNPISAPPTCHPEALERPR